MGHEILRTPSFNEKYLVFIKKKVYLIVLPVVFHLLLLFYLLVNAATIKGGEITLLYQSA